MRISRRKRYQKRVVQTPGAQYNFNERIKSPSLLVIDETGTSLGIISTEKALSLARERELDLVEVSPLANPPVAKILDFGAFKYQKEKEARKQKAKQVDVKGIRLSARIGEHDLEVRMKQAVGFLKDGHKVKLELPLHGRERQFADRARILIQDFTLKVDAVIPCKMESPIEKQDNRLTTVLARR